MSLQPRPEIKDLKACPHGGINYAEVKAKKLDAGTILDFSVSSNPYMPPPGTRKIINRIAVEQYPDSAATEFSQRLAGTLGLSADNIIAGSGTTELIRLISLTYFRQGDPVLILEPTFGEYEIAGQIAGARLLKQWTREEEGFVPRIEETVGLIKKHQPRAVFICNPNNPTGKYLPQSAVGAVAEAMGDGLLVLDEAYVSFVAKSWPSTDLLSRNVVILRSMTKDYGLAGLRLGYAIARPDIIASLRRVCPPWNVNTVAQKVGTACLDHADYLEQTQEKLRKAKQFLVDRLSGLGLPPLPSDANFFLVKVGNARSFRAALLNYGIMVRDCTSFGLPEYIRIAPRTMPQCRKLIAAIQSLRQKGEL